MIALYGATGYTGQLVASELEKQKLAFCLCGRDRRRLDHLSSSLTTAPPVRVASIGDSASLKLMLDDCEVVIDCAGPFSKLGTPIVEAALATSTHYLDTTGEQHYIRLLFEQYHARAKAAKVTLMPAMGFDYALGDALAGAVAEGRGRMRVIRVGYVSDRFTPSRGTIRTSVGMLAEPTVEYRDSDWRSARRPARRAQLHFPLPFGRLPVIQFGAGEVITVPRHVDVREVTGWYAFSGVPGGSAALAIGASALSAAGLLLRSPLGKAAEAAFSLLPDGPDTASRSNAQFAVKVTAVTAGGAQYRGEAVGSDVYGFTAHTIVAGAQKLAAEGWDRYGTLSSSMAFGARPFLEELAAFGLDITLPE